MKNTFPATVIFLLLLIISTTGDVGVKVAEGRTCQSQSQRFKGLCFSDRNCGSVCKTEGFSSGNCRGALQRCFCTRSC